jgi:hypothetical protein
MNIDDSDANRGFYDKFIVKRTDGRDTAGEKHAGCAYFVLDLDHDPHAGPAILAYAQSCQESHPKLAADLRPIAALINLRSQQEERERRGVRRIKDTARDREETSKGKGHER